VLQSQRLGEAVQLFPVEKGRKKKKLNNSKLSVGESTEVYRLLKCVPIETLSLSPKGSN
jgi:hypothetical protein